MKLYSDNVGLYYWLYNQETKVMNKDYQFKWLCSEIKH